MDRTQPIVWQTPKKVLIINHKHIFQLYKMQGRQIDEELLSETALEHYLKNSTAYLGKKNSQSFALFRNGIPVTAGIPIYENNRPMNRQQRVIAQALCFDYRKIVDEFNVNLELSVDANSNEEQG